MALNVAREFAYGIRLDNSALESDARAAKQSIQGVGDTIKSVGKEAEGASPGVEKLSGSLDGMLRIGVGAWAGTQLGGLFLSMNRALVDAQINADRLQLQLGASAGAASAARELEYVRGVTNKLGLELNSTAVSYARFSAAANGTAMSSANVRKVFESVTTAAAVMGLSTDETQGTLRALEQMMSKGVVQAEELRGQLGDRLPGALQIAARAMGVTTAELQKMVERGEVMATDFLPRFAQQLQDEIGGGAEAAANRMQASVNRIGNAWETLKQNIAASGVSEFIRGQMEGAAGAMNHLSGALQTSREQGEGFLSQLLAVGAAAHQVGKPFADLSATSLTMGGRLEVAAQQLANIRAELDKAPTNIYLKSAAFDAERLVESLQRARAASINLRAIDNNMIARTEKEAEDASIKRKNDLAESLGKVYKGTNEYHVALTRLANSRSAGELAEKVFLGHVKAVNEHYLPKPSRGTKGAKGKQVVQPPITHPPDALFHEEAQRMAREAERIEQFMLGKVLASDQREQERQERRQQQAAAFGENLLADTARINAGLLTTAEARGQAMLAIERAELSSRLELLEVSEEQRRQLQEAASGYLLARERQLTEELKPEWQRRLEGWANTTQLMRDAYDGMMDGFLTKGEEAFTELLRTGKLNTRALVQYVGDELAKLAYKKYIAPAASGAFGSLLGVLGLGGGTGYSGGAAVGGATGGGFSGFEFGPGRATGGGTRAGALHPINEGGEPEVFTARNGRSWLLSGGAGWVSTLGAAGGGNAAAGGAGQTVQHITYNVPAGMSPAAFAAALEANNQALRGQVAADLARPGRPLQRAAAAGLA